MSLLTLVLWGSSSLLEFGLLWRAKTARLLSRLPLFYSYVAYTFLGSIGTFLIYWLRADVYSYAFWPYYLVRILAEFAILAQISDEVFRPFPAIAYLGRVAVVLTAVVFSGLFLLPSFSKSPSSSLAILRFALWASLAKVVAIGAIIGATRYYRLRLTRSIAGLMIGFVLYLSVYGTSFAAHLAFGSPFSRRVLQFIGPAGWLVCVLTWTVALWNPELSEPLKEKQEAFRSQPYGDLSQQIAGLNEALSKRLRR